MPEQPQAQHPIQLHSHFHSFTPSLFHSCCALSAVMTTSFVPLFHLGINGCSTSVQDKLKVRTDFVCLFCFAASFFCSCCSLTHLRNCLCCGLFASIVRSKTRLRSLSMIH